MRAEFGTRATEPDADVPTSLRVRPCTVGPEVAVAVPMRGDD